MILTYCFNGITFRMHSGRVIHIVQLPNSMRCSSAPWLQFRVGFANIMPKYSYTIFDIVGGYPLIVTLEPASRCLHRSMHNVAHILI